MNFSDKLKAKLSSEVFTQADISIALGDYRQQAIHSGISRSLRSGDILKLKRGLYLFGERLRRDPISLFSISNRMYAPSYVSFESALSHHGLIPEAVYVTTSACYLRKKKQFNTLIGDFTFDYVPGAPFFQGVGYATNGRNTLIANPLKALFDLIYQRKVLYSDLEDLESDLRIDIDSLQEYIAGYSYKVMEQLAVSYRKKNITTIFLSIAREMK